MVSNVLDIVLDILLDIVVNKFELQSRYYFHFRTNTIGKGMNFLILYSYGLNINSTTNVRLQ